MSVNRAIESLLMRQDLWRGQPEQQVASGYDTGFPELVDSLPKWPAHGICELLTPVPGAGELGLLLPLLRQYLSAETYQPVALVAPNFIPNAQTLAWLQLPPEYFLWLDVTERREALWAMEQLLANGSCPLVLGWFAHLSLKEARRLQLAAESGNALGFCLLPVSQAGNNHPVPLKLALEPLAGNRSRLQILKRRGGWPVPEIVLSGVMVPGWYALAEVTLSSPSNVVAGPWDHAQESDRQVSNYHD
ncbi:translesion DNA synthesis-associated protein ImuA [Shewanella yunxiaonensis]|uniref:Translesion DNA synthesis-associated protein ImuA n=1 Tax=Shewanella yunxiaonensis TaxID=2829809 RepID=A0ABX7YNZ9_9GAMM|nr:translesion DNA synthesis-associated protein ImuA [Shewanella yunxiaonensis]QUN04473.1 translesion DNA synthesis-associated protein ImuA [Shewanella yunxiaonensis]